MRNALRLAAAYAVTAGLAALLVVRFAARGSTVTVPALTGMDLKAVQTLLAGRGLEVSVETEQWSESVPSGSVIAQTPPANARVKRGRRIQLTLSRGSEELTMPKLVETPEDEAEFLLRQLGLELASVATAPALAARRTITAQEPAEGERIHRGDPVRLLVSDGPSAPAFAEPRVVGLPTRDALAKLRDAGLKITEVAYETSTLVAEGAVIAQDPPGGFATVAGSEVRLRAAFRSTRGLARWASFTWPVPPGPSRRVRVLIIDEGGSREIANDIEEGGSTLRLSTQVQGEAVAQFFIGGTLQEERKL